MRLNITLSIEDSVLEVFDLQRGGKSRGDYIAELLKCSSSAGSSTLDKLVVPPSALKKAKDEGYDTSNYLESKLIPGEKEFKTYFKERKNGKQK